MIYHKAAPGKLPYKRFCVASNTMMVDKQIAGGILLMIQILQRVDAISGNTMSADLETGWNMSGRKIEGFIDALASKNANHTQHQGKSGIEWRYSWTELQQTGHYRSMKRNLCLSESFF